MARNGWIVALTVVCHHTKDTDLIHDGTTERLGTVPPGATQRFTVPVRRLGPGGRFHLGATEGYVTEELNATGGEEIRWKLEKYLAQSSCTTNSLPQV
ncbi:MAG TPA: hypothetical protein VLB12_14270 [Gemmatimonadales bacterium]|nr:hypothetical protein [Gemmatimonadales bacterium]